MRQHLVKQWFKPVFPGNCAPGACSELTADSSTMSLAINLEVNLPTHLAPRTAIIYTPYVSVRLLPAEALTDSAFPVPMASGLHGSAPRLSTGRGAA